MNLIYEFENWCQEHFGKGLGMVSTICRREVSMANLQTRNSSEAPAKSLAMESQMVQNSGTKIGFTPKKFSIKVKTDFNQAQQNQFTLNGLSLKVKT